jgi:endo-1,4-beta-xylanase
MLKNHIQTVVSHYKGKVAGWDVVNEAFLDDGSLRPTIWSDHIPDYIAKSFLWAREADPNVILFYNDYGQDGKPKKMQAILDLVADFKKRNVPIDGLGLQMHVNINSKNEAILEVITKSAATGLHIHFSELDVAVNPKNNPDFVYDDVAKDEQLNKFLLLFNSFKSIPLGQQYGITFWNVGDKDSWLRGYFKRPKENPLLFDDSYARKPAYKVLYQTLK